MAAQLVLNFPLLLRWLLGPRRRGSTCQLLEACTFASRWANSAAWNASCCLFVFCLMQLELIRVHSRGARLHQMTLGVRLHQLTCLQDSDAFCSLGLLRALEADPQFRSRSHDSCAKHLWPLQNADMSQKLRRPPCYSMSRLLIALARVLTSTIML